MSRQEFAAEDLHDDLIAPTVFTRDPRLRRSNGGAVKPGERSRFIRVAQRAIAPPIIYFPAGGCTRQGDESTFRDAPQTRACAR